MSSLFIPKDLQIPIFQYALTEDLHKIKDIPHFQQAYQLGVEDRVKIYISQWQNAKENPESRENLIKDFFVREASDILNLPAENLYRLLKEIQLTNGEVCAIYHKLMGGGISWNAILLDPSFNFLNLTINKKPQLELLRILVWKMLFRDRKKISINFSTIARYESDEISDQCIHTLGRVAKMVGIEMIHIENSHCTRSMKQILRSYVKTVQFQDCCYSLSTLIHRIITLSLVLISYAVWWVSVVHLDTDTFLVECLGGIFMSFMNSPALYMISLLIYHRVTKFFEDRKLIPISYEDYQAMKLLN